MGLPLAQVTATPVLQGPTATGVAVGICATAVANMQAVSAADKGTRFIVGCNTPGLGGLCRRSSNQLREAAVAREGNGTDTTSPPCARGRGWMPPPHFLRVESLPRFAQPSPPTRKTYHGQLVHRVRPG